MPAIRSSVSTRGPSYTPLTWPASSMALGSSRAATTPMQEELEGTTIHGVVGFNFQGTLVYLTYAQVGGLSVDQVEDFFRSLPHVKEWVLGKEFHQDGGKP